MPTVEGILETAISVADVRKSAAFYRRIFDFPILLESDRLIALDVAGRSVLLLFQASATEAPYPTSGGIIPGHGISGRAHFAFSVTADDFPRWQQHLQSLQVPVESVVNWPTGTQSLYLRDPDNHLVELITPGFWRGH